jgi:uncharacterized protein YndB with AHSA1/START domain
MTYTTDVTEQGDNEIVITRSFAAPPQLVFDALTKPDLMRRWLKGPDGWSMDVCDVDLREGGRYRYGWSGPNDHSMEIAGEYRTINRPSRLVTTEEMSGTEHTALSSAVLAAHGSETRMTTTMTYPSQEARDQAIASNMAAGVAASHKWLETVLEEIAGEDVQ